jgi:hypothetical protein
MIVDRSLSLEKYCYSVTMVSGSFPTRRWGCQDMGRLIDLASGDFEPIHHLEQRTYKLSLYYYIGQLCQPSSQSCNGGSSVPCLVPHTIGLRGRGWAMQTRTSFLCFARLRPSPTYLGSLAWLIHYIHMVTAARSSLDKCL